MTDWTSTSGFVGLSDADGIAVVTLQRAEKLNALTVPMLHDIASAIEHAGRSSRGVVLTGEGRAMSAGDDLPATDDLSPEDFEALLSGFQAVTLTTLRAPVPVVAALNGIVVGGAAEMVLACDARVGWARSDFLFPENDVGLTISNASTYLLPRLLGPRALPVVLDARRIPGPEAAALGLLDYVVDSAEEVLPKALAVVERWTTRGLATRFHLQLLRPPIAEVERAIEREVEVGRAAWASGSAREGIARFVREQEAKRRPDGA